MRGMIKEGLPWAGRKKKKVCRVCGCTDTNCKECIELTGCPCHWVEQDLCSVCADIGKLTVKPKKHDAAVRWNKMHPAAFEKRRKEIMDRE